jgi:hypothetical protein
MIKLLLLAILLFTSLPFLGGNKPLRRQALQTSWFNYRHGKNAMRPANRENVRPVWRRKITGRTDLKFL